MPDHLRPITVEIPVTWTAEQALAVWEMLDQLRENLDPLQQSTARSAGRGERDSAAGGRSDSVSRKITGISCLVMSK
jgi:hypothetical protein